jgi:hypothetical protein
MPLHTLHSCHGRSVGAPHAAPALKKSETARMLMQPTTPAELKGDFEYRGQKKSSCPIPRLTPRNQAEYDLNRSRKNTDIYLTSLERSCSTHSLNGYAARAITIGT